MKKIILLVVISLMIVTLVSAQTVLFHENFEAPSFGDSLISTADTAIGSNLIPLANFKPWSISTNLSHSGLRCDTNTLQTFKMNYLTSTSFSTVGINYVCLQFSHICKLHFADGGSVEVSTDNGITWFALSPSYSMDSGVMIQNKFCENSYQNLWLPGDTITKPTNAWWRTQRFDISAITNNSPNVKIRFRYYSTGLQQAAGRYGWLIDDVKVYQMPAPNYTITTNASPSNGGTTSGGGVFIANQNDTIKAIPNTGFTFLNWTENGGIISVDSIFVLYYVNNNRNFTATFIPVSLPCSASFMIVPDTTTPHHYFVLNNASGIHPLKYTWSWGDGTHDTIAFPSHTYTSAGYYNICLSIIDSLGCTSTFCDSSYIQKSTNSMISVSVIPQGTLSINNNETSNQIKIYPNPAKDILTIDLQSKGVLHNTIVSIYNLEGQLLLQQSLQQNNTELNINSFAKGMYVVKISNDKKTYVGKFVKE